MIVVFLFSLIAIHDVYAPPPPPPIPIYTISAHGNPSYGVNRTGLSSFNYSIGNCAHCHEQHASIGGAEPDPAGGAPSKYMLFGVLGSDQNTRFCYKCHQEDPSTPSLQVSMPYQYNYSGIAGGDTTLTQPSACPNDIKDAFLFIRDDCTAARSNCGSSVGSAHCLDNIQDFLKNSWNFPAKVDVQPCSGCHNPHRTQRDYSSTGFLWANGVSSLSRPSQHNKDNNVWELWGDENDERMDDYTALYQAPCRYPWSDPCTSFEPDGYGASDASRTVNSVIFCLDCHSSQRNSTRYGTVSAINWGASGDEHGQNYDSGGGGGMRDKAAPYADDGSYVLSCLDCHEPHGSKNEFLLRATVNGTQVPLFIAPGRYYYFCKGCHAQFHGGGMGDTQICRGCHYHGSNF